MSDNSPNNITDEVPGAAEPTKEVWAKPEIVSYRPAVSAQGISYTPADGISNLTP